MSEKEIPSVSIIVPTYNEKDNLPELVKNIFSVVKKDKFDLEIVIVDDNSPDGTADVARELSKKYSLHLVSRSEKSGLSSAVVDGIKSAKGDIIGVMDGDLSHDPVIIPKMIDAIARQKNQLVVGSRDIKGGKIENWPLARRIISWVAVLIAFPFTGVKDRTSGYFFFKRDILDGVTLDPKGFKIGLEIMVKGNYKRWKEIPYTFKNRTTGKSKMNVDEIKNYLSQLRSYIFYKKQLTVKD
ncbi:MAG: polyprenol monophosphomannose synthase [Candidatus Eremiobacterota bacterium]